MMHPTRRLFSTIACAALAATAVPASAAPDPGKKACIADAKLICPAEMKAMSRKRVQACLIVKIEQTSPICHATMLKLKAEHEAALAVKR